MTFGKPLYDIPTELGLTDTEPATECHDFRHAPDPPIGAARLSCSVIAKAVSNRLFCSAASAMFLAAMSFGWEDGVMDQPPTIVPLEFVPARQVLAREDAGFTRWLSEHLEYLEPVLGLTSMELVETESLVGSFFLDSANGGYLTGEAERAADWIVTCCRAWLDVLRASPVTDAELAAAAATAAPAGQDARK